MIVACKHSQTTPGADDLIQTSDSAQNRTFSRMPIDFLGKLLGCLRVLVVRKIDRSSPFGNYPACNTDSEVIRHIARRVRPTAMCVVLKCSVLLSGAVWREVG